MANILNKFLDYIGLDKGYDEEEFMDETFVEEEESKETLSFTKSNKKKAGGNDSNVVSMPNTATQKMIVYHPISYEDTQNIIDNLKSRKPVIVNMEELERDCAQRILDFMAGAVYALNGTIYRVSRGIFTVAPNNYDVIGNDEASDYSGRM